MANSLDGVTGGNPLASMSTPPSRDRTSGGSGGRARSAAGTTLSQRRRKSATPDAPVQGEITDLVPPDGSVRAPSYSYVLRILRGREREMGASASGSRSVRDSGTRLANAQSRSFTDIVREIRRRRKLLVTPPIP